jgi:hypothetical protein
MSEIGTEPLGPAAPVTERVSNQSPRDQNSRDQAPGDRGPRNHGSRNHGPRPRREPAVPSDSNSEPADRSGTPPHQIDSLA